MVVNFYSDDPSSNPVETYRFYSVKLLEKNENKHKRGMACFFKKELKLKKSIKNFRIIFVKCI